MHNQPEAPLYSILEAHDRTDGTHKPIEELETEYVQLTDKLIHAMTYGVETMVNGERQNVVPTKVIFLDKSARPLAWLTRELWDVLAPEPDETVVPVMPDMKFLNIDRRQYLTDNQIRDVTIGNNDFTIESVINKVPEENIIGLRSIFGSHHDGSYDAENELDGQNILVIDEVKSSGATLEIAQALIRRAFPTSNVAGMHWMEKSYERKGAKGNADLPIWYHDDSDPSTRVKNEVGRGVRNRVENEEMLQQNPTLRFLSQRFSKPDMRSLALRKDISILGERIRSGDALYEPYRFRDDSSQEKRTQNINGLSLEETYRRRRDIGKRALDKTLSQI